MPAESMIQTVLDLAAAAGNEVRRGISGVNHAPYKGLWDSTGATTYIMGDVVRYVSTGDEDCGDALWVLAVDQLEYQTDDPDFDSSLLTPCVLSADDASPWFSPNESLDLWGSGDPNDQEGDSNGAIPAPLASTFVSYSGGSNPSQEWIHNPDGTWSQIGAGSAPTPIDLDGSPVWNLTQGTSGPTSIDGSARGVLTPITDGVWQLDAWVRGQVPDGFDGEDEQAIELDLVPLFSSLDISADEFRAGEGVPVGHAAGTIASSRTSLGLHAVRGSDSAGTVVFVDSTGALVTAGLVDADVLEVQFSCVVWAD